MRKSLTASMAAAALTFAVSFSVPAYADGAPDPSVHQIYEAAEAGHFDQAQTMMDQVLRDHPKSAKAHYVQAELFAKQNKTSLARAELAQAEELDPGLPHENQRSVQSLKSELGMAAPAPRNSGAPRPIGMTGPAPAPAPHIPWGLVLIVVAGVFLLWMVFRRRAPAPAQFGGGPGMGAPGYGSGPGYGGPSGYGGPGGAVGGGMGSGIVGGLASGLAVGAGVVAGEEVAHHFLDGGGRETNVVPQPENSDWSQPSSNSDMGGTDFGVNDGGGWDDSGGGGGGGSDDWT